MCPVRTRKRDRTSRVRGLCRTSISSGRREIARARGSEGVVAAEVEAASVAAAGLVVAGAVGGRVAAAVLVGAVVMAGAAAARAVAAGARYLVMRIRWTIASSSSNPKTA